MGFLDKAKAGLSNTGNYANQKSEEADFNSKINDQNRKKKELLEEAANKMFALYKDGKMELDDDVKKVFESAVACETEAARLEEEKAKMIAKYEGERQDKRDEVKAKEEKEKAEKEAAKAEKEKSE